MGNSKIPLLIALALINHTLLAMQPAPKPPAEQEPRVARSGEFRFIEEYKPSESYFEKIDADTRIKIAMQGRTIKKKRLPFLKKCIIPSPI